MKHTVKLSHQNCTEDVCPVIVYIEASGKELQKAKDIAEWFRIDYGLKQESPFVLSNATYKVETNFEIK